MHTLLIGLRGSGKSAVARVLSRALRRPVIDLDAEVCRALGAATVTEAFETFGESAWRRAEVDALRMLLAQREELVAALGGGTPVAPGAEALLREAAVAGRARTVFLDVEPAVLIARRSADDQDRPALQIGETLEQEVMRTHRERIGMCRACATVTVEVRDERESAEETAARVLEALGGGTDAP